MNKIHRSIWNKLTGTCVAVAENTSVRSGEGTLTGSGAFVGSFKLLTMALALVTAGIAYAEAPGSRQLPAGANLVAGQASVVKNNSQMTITQSSNRAILDWSTFNVGKDATVSFVQPSSTSAILNRVLDTNPSQILGRINANGQVFLTNSSGIYFGKDSTVNVGAFTATTHDIKNEDFSAGRFAFNRKGASGSITNDGNITASLGGYVALLGSDIRNGGVIVAKLGTVALAAGEEIELQFEGERLGNIRVTPSSIAALVENGNAVHAPGGTILLSAHAASRLQAGVINNAGRLEANGLVNDGGTIRLLASDSIRHAGQIEVDAAVQSTGKGGTAIVLANLNNADSTTHVNGSVSARGGNLGGDGGFVETSASQLKVGESARVNTSAPRGKTGEWLLDPTDFYIVSGNSPQTSSSIGATTLTTALAGSNVTISTAAAGAESGDIIVDAPLSWSSNTLSLQAHGNVSVHNVMSLSGTAALDVKFGYSTPGTAGGTYDINKRLSMGFNTDGTFRGRVDFSGSSGLTINDNVYTLINSLGAEGSTTGTDLQGMLGNLSGYYALASNIDASATSGWNAGEGFLPIGDTAASFNGVFDGLGHTITGLTINRPASLQVGLFGYAEVAKLRNVGVINAAVSGKDYVGVLAGNCECYTNNNYATGTLTAYAHAGGLIGYSLYGWLTDSHAGVNVSGTAGVGGAGNNVGGLLGEGFGTTISYSYATGSLTRGTDIGTYWGGLIGYLNGDVSNPGYLSHSYATGTILARNFTGGLVGYNNGEISNSYYSGSVTGTNFNNAGLVGFNAVKISNSYAVGSVSGTNRSWGLVGTNNTGAVIENSFAAVTLLGAAPQKAGFVGSNLGTITNSFYDKSLNPALPGYGDGKVEAGGGLKSMTSAEMKTQLNFTSSTTANGSVNPNWNFTPLTGTWGMDSAINSGYPCLVGVSCKKDIYVRLALGASNYGDTPGLAYGLYSSSTGGYSITDASPSGTAVWSSPLTNTSNQGTYSQSYVSGVSIGSSQYTLNIGSAANWVINPRPITVQANNQSRAFGDANPTTGAVTLTSGTLANSDALGTATVSSTATSTTAVGQTAALTPSNVSFTSGSASNYAITYTDGILSITSAGGVVTITLRPITVQANNQSRPYGDANPTSGAVTLVSGTLLGGDSLGKASLTSSATQTTAAGQTSALIPSALTFGSGDAANYIITYVNGTLSITQRPITVTALNQSRAYGDTNPTTGTVTLTSGSLANSDALGTATVSSNASNTTAAGQTAALIPSSQTFTTGSAGNYAITYADGTLSITQRPIAVQANNQSRAYGGANPTTGVVTLTSGTLVNGDALGTASVSSTATNTTAAGQTAALIPASQTFATGSPGNYAITYVDGALTITPRPITVLANDQSRAYGDANPTTGTVTLTSGSLANSDALGTATVSSNASNTTAAGQTAALIPSSQVFTTGSAGNYAITYADGTLSITQRPITVQANNQSRAYGGANPTTGVVTLTSGTLVNGDALGTASVSSTATNTTAAGQTAALIPASQTFTTGSPGNYAITYVNGTLSITPVQRSFGIPQVELPIALPSQSAATCTFSADQGAMTNLAGMTGQSKSSTDSTIEKSESNSSQTANGSSALILCTASAQPAQEIVVSSASDDGSRPMQIQLQLPAHLLNALGANNSIQITALDGGQFPQGIQYRPEQKPVMAGNVLTSTLPVRFVVLADTPVANSLHIGSGQ